MPRHTSFVAGLALGLLAGLPAMAGVVVVTDQVGTDGKPIAGKALLDADRLRLDTPEGALIFRADQRAAFMVNDAKRSFHKMTPQTMQQMRAGVDAALEQMRQQMQSLPPEQRKMIEERMGQAGMAGGGPRTSQITYRKTGANETFGKWRCDTVEQLIDGRRTGEFCMARLDALGLTPADVKPFSDLAAFMQEGMGNAMGPRGAFDFARLSDTVGYQGFPVHVSIFNGQTKVQETTTRSVERTAVPGSTFEVPAGYQEEAMPMPPRRPAG